MIAALGLGVAILALVMARTRARGLVGAVLGGVAWTLAVVLAVALPDHRPLMGVARAPIVLAGLPFGWPRVEPTQIPPAFPPLGDPRPHVGLLA